MNSSVLTVLVQVVQTLEHLEQVPAERKAVQLVLADVVLCLLLIKMIILADVVSTHTLRTRGAVMLFQYVATSH